MISETNLRYDSAGKSYVGLLLRTEANLRAAVVILPDWRGQSALAREHAVHLVGSGCAVVIADLYGDGFSPTSPEQVGPMVQRLVNQRHEGVKALAACVAAFRQEVGEDKPIVCLGFSAGGMIALDYARSGAEISGVILCSALLKTAGEGMKTSIRAPVLFLQGTQDQVSPMAVINDLIEEMDQAGNDARFLLFAQTHHAFDNPEAGTDPAARLVYSPASAARARVAIENFIGEVLGKVG